MDNFLLSHFCCPVHQRMLSSDPGLHSLDFRSVHIVTATKIISRDCQMSLRENSRPVENHQFRCIACHMCVHEYVFNQIVPQECQCLNQSNLTSQILYCNLKRFSMLCLNGITRAQWITWVLLQIYQGALTMVHSLPICSSFRCEPKSLQR